MKIDPKELPQNLEQCHALIAQLAGELDQKDRKLRRILHQLEKLLRWRYGPQRERIDPNQMFLFAVALVEKNQDITGENKAGGKEDICPYVLVEYSDRSRFI